MLINIIIITIKTVTRIIIIVIISSSTFVSKGCNSDSLGALGKIWHDQKKKKIKTTL